MRTRRAHDDAQDLVLPHRLDHEPIVILGLTKSELLLLTFVAAALCLPLGMVVGVVLGKWTMGLPIGFLSIVLVDVSVGVMLVRVKRQRPDGYYQQRLRIALQEWGLFRGDFIRHHGVWDVRRHCDG